jgi:mono/diheme cytochrome c family protein
MKKILLGFLILTLGIGSSKAQSPKPWIAPVSANQLKNPLAGNISVLKDAKILYITNCAPCHGNTGKGDGIAAAALKPKPADHTSAAIQGETDGSLFWKMTEGHTPMPAYKQALTDNQRWQLVNYIRSLAKHK